jgi:hypothetical protein
MTEVYTTTYDRAQENSYRRYWVACDRHDDVAQVVIGTTDAARVVDEHRRSIDCRRAIATPTSARVRRRSS